MESVKSYNKTELSKIQKISYSRINKDKDLYIPIRIETAQSRATKKGYTIRYVRNVDIMRYLQNNPVKKRILDDRKIKKDLKK